MPGSEVSTRSGPSAEDRPVQQAPNDPPSRVKADQTELTVSVIRLGKTVLVVPSPRRAPLQGSHPRATPEREDASEPPLGPDPERLVFCSLHDVKLPDVAIRAVSDSNLPRSRDRTGRLIVGMNLPVGSKPASWPARGLVGRGGVEPPTSRLSGVRSNHLSYRPIPWAGWPSKPLVEPVAPEARQPKIDRLHQTQFGGAYRDRTDDLLNAIQSLSQLS